MKSRIVTHSLVLWNLYSGTVAQEVKDFFDEQVDLILSFCSDELLCAKELVYRRLLYVGYSPQEANAIAKRLLLLYTQKYLSVHEPTLLSMNT